MNKELEQITQSIKNDVTTLNNESAAVFIYHNPENARQTGAHAYGTPEDITRLVSVFVNQFTDEQKRFLYSHLLLDDPDTLVSSVEEFLNNIEE